MANDVLKKLGAMLTSRVTKDVVKAVVAYLLGAIFVFSPTLNSWLQPRVLSNVLLIVIVHTPARTVGQYFDSSVILILSILAGGFSWALINWIAGVSHPGMAVLLFIIVYLFSILRTINPIRYFGASLVGPLLAFLAITSATGVAGPSTAIPGEALDRRFLGDTIVAMLLGIALGAVVNVGMWPDFAEIKLREQFGEVFDVMGMLLSAITDGYLLKREKSSHPVEAEAIFEEIRLVRSTHISTLRGLITGLTATLDAADAEISYSHMSMSDFTRLHNSVQALSGHLFALDTALSDMGRSLMDDEQLRERFLTPLEEPLRSLQGGCLSMLDETRREVGGGGEGGETEACNGAVRKAVAQFEEKQFEVLFDLFEMRFGVVSEGDAEERAGRLGWDSLMQVNFLILGIHEFVDELINTHSHLHSLDPKKTFHFHFRHFVPKTIYDFFKRKPAPDMESARTTNLKSDDDNPTSPSAAADILVKSVSTVPAIKKKRGFEFRTAVMLPLTKFWLSPASIYAMKCATAVLLLNLIVYAQPQFSLTWGLQGSVITFLVAIAPSLGQTYLGFPMQLIATFIGALWAFAALSAFGASGAIGIIAFGLILVTPMMYIFLFNKAMPVLGLLAMLSFSNSVVLSYINRNRPFDAPVVRLYKNLANVTMGLTFALIFTLAIYPNLARRSLRALLSSTITLINGYYADLTCNLMSNTLSKRSSPILDLNDMKMEDLPQDTIARLRDTHNAIALKLAACEPLMIFSSVEPRVEGAFQGKSYRSVIEGLKRVLDRLGNARAAAGAKRFPPKMKWLFTDPKLSKARAELYQTIRLLLFIFSSTFIAKQRLPHDLPNAFAARKRLVESFMELAAKASDGHTAQYRSEAWVRFYSYALAIRGISLEMDALAIPIKELFGELPDITFGSGDPGSYGVEGEDAEDDEMARVAEMNAAYTSLLAVRGVNEGLLEEAMEDDAVRNEEVVYDFERKVT